MRTSTSLERVGQATSQEPYALIGKYSIEYGGTGAAPKTDAEILADAYKDSEESQKDDFATASTTAPKIVRNTDIGNIFNLTFLMSAADASAAVDDVAFVKVVHCYHAAGNAKTSGGGDIKPMWKKTIPLTFKLNASATVGIAVEPASAADIAKYVPTDKQSLYWFYPNNIELVRNGVRGGADVLASMPPEIGWDYNGAGQIEIWVACVASDGSTTRTTGGVIVLGRPC